MDPRLQRRVQRYGWDLAANDYEPLWQAQLAVAQAALLELASPAPNERVLDVACGARRRAQERKAANVNFLRMDAEALELPEASFDVALCAFGLMYVPEPE